MVRPTSAISPTCAHVTRGRYPLAPAWRPEVRRARTLTRSPRGLGPVCAFGVREVRNKVESSYLPHAEPSWPVSPIQFALSVRITPVLIGQVFVVRETDKFPTRDVSFPFACYRPEGAGD